MLWWFMQSIKISDTPRWYNSRDVLSAASGAAATPLLAFKISGQLEYATVKLDAGEYDAIILAVAGLQRLGMSDRIHQVLPAEVSLHAVGQGALGIECRADDTEVLSLLRRSNMFNARSRQRSVPFCGTRRWLQVPIGVNTQLDADTLTLTGIVVSVDGKS